MLYVTTRTQRDAHTAFRTLSEDRGPCGGLFLPRNMPCFDSRQIARLADKSFSQNVAEMVNLLFGTELDSWAIEFAIGRYPVKLVSVSSRVSVAQTWHNPSWQYQRLAKGIEKAVRQSDQVSQTPSEWLMVASRIAVLFGIFGELLRSGGVSPDSPIDVAVASGDFSGVMAVWYARKWGLPIANIVCCCNENAAPWNLLHKGELRTDAAVIRTATPACDHAVPMGMERLICETLGRAEALRFAQACAQRQNYYLEKYQTDDLRRGIHVAAVSGSRMESTVAALYRTNGYICDPCTALVYSGLIDYRSRTGEGRPALILSEESPAFSFALIAKCLGTTPAELKKRLEKA